MIRRRLLSLAIPLRVVHGSERRFRQTARLANPIAAQGERRIDDHHDIVFVCQILLEQEGDLGDQDRRTVRFGLGHPLAAKSVDGGMDNRFETVSLGLVSKDDRP